MGKMKEKRPSRPRQQSRRLTLEEWMAEGTRRFGQDMFHWKFVCPSCGNVQTPEDFRQHKDRGATPDSARFNCIGRYVADRKVYQMCEGGQPCNYTSGGLFNIAPWTVINAEGKDQSCFAFAEEGDDAAAEEVSKEGTPGDVSVGSGEQPAER